MDIGDLTMDLVREKDIFFFLEIISKDNVNMLACSFPHPINFWILFLRVDLLQPENFSAWSLMNPCFMTCGNLQLKNPLIVLICPILELVLIKIIFVLYMH